MYDKLARAQPTGSKRRGRVKAEHRAGAGAA
jgi:hypothetical protein